MVCYFSSTRNYLSWITRGSFILNWLYIMNVIYFLCYKKAPSCMKKLLIENYYLVAQCQTSYYIISPFFSFKYYYYLFWLLKKMEDAGGSTLDNTDTDMLYCYSCFTQHKSNDQLFFDKNSWETQEKARDGIQQGLHSQSGELGATLMYEDCFILLSTDRK